jgi:LAGLIDADG DNA endonuclease family protein
MLEVDEGTGNYLAGFADGEGCFYVGIHPTSNVANGLQVVPEFHVSQNGERISVLKLFVDVFGCGTIKKNASANSNDKTWVFVIKKHNDLFESLLPFFRRFPLRSEKQQEFLKFAEVVQMMHRKEHLTVDGLKKILNMAFSMNGSRYRKHILANLLDCLEPSETIRQVPASAGEDIVRTA